MRSSLKPINLEVMTMRKVTNNSDTIFALATPPGRSAIAVIRVSGPQALAVPALFGAACPAAGTFAVARLYDGAFLIDEAVLLCMQGPRSSTGEDVCELHCHGSIAAVRAVLDKLADAKGFRLAEAGEFTRRGFINDKIDLLGVEGLADLIDADTPLQLQQAWAQIDGALRGPVETWRAHLVGLASKLEALIDFADEDLPQTVDMDLRRQTALLIADIGRILDDNRAGELVRDGVVVALIGPVNAGKSTILNGLAGRAAAIVSEEAGTTRDIISIRLELAGVPTTILDTAGVRDAAGAVESEGIRRAIEAAQNADLVVLVVDAATPSWSQDIANLTENLTENLAENIAGNLARPPMIVLNKADKAVIGTVPADAIAMSAHNDQDMAQFIDLLAEKIRPLNLAQHSAIITRVRHRRALQDAHLALQAGLRHDFHSAPELAAEDFRHAATALGRITGYVDVEELLGQIFSTFCIGK